MAKPRLIILVRHAQSEGNKNREIHQAVPDHRVKLTQEGWSQAHEAGLRLRHLLRPTDTLHFFTSPYRRTRETTEGILETLTSDDPGPSPFRRANIKVYEEPRLREQDFGNFQPCSAEMERMWQERADYGHFFYRIPNGESAADAYDRVSGFNESLWRQFGEDDFASVCVLVTHGLMSRVFLMKWYHFSVEYFEDLRNVNHCEFLIMRKQDNGKYLLENNLRTWSDLRRERALKEAKEGAAKDGSAPKETVVVPTRPERSKTFTATRRWGGCPNGCNHSRHYKKREDLDLLRQRDVEHATSGTATPSTATTTTTASTWRQRERPPISSDEEDCGSQCDGSVGSTTKTKPPHIDLVRTTTANVEDPLSSSEAQHTPPSASLDHEHTTPLNATSIAAKCDRLHVGRDFGGTYSGHASTAGSDTEASEDEHHRQHHHHHRRLDSLNARIRIANATAVLQNELADRTDDADSADGRATFTNRLGDVRNEHDTGSDGDVEPEDLDKAEKEDRSIQGSVY